MQRFHLLMWLGLLSFLVFSTLSSAATVTLKQGVDGYTGCTDTYMDSDYPNSNYGELFYVHLYVRNNDPERSGLIRFDLSGRLPSDAVISSATLGLWVYQLIDMSGSDLISLTVYRLASGRDWAESSATWNQYKSGFYWTTPGAENVPYDRSGTWDDYRYFYASTQVDRYFTWNVTSSVSAWVSGSAPNNGWLLRPEHDYGSEGLSLWSSEYSTTDKRPYLTITYTGSLNWTGSVSNTWDTATANWRPAGGSGATIFGSGDTAIFDDTASQFSVVISGTVTPASVTVNSSSNYTFSGGSIGGSASLGKAGSGSLYLTAANTYTGSTVINGGKVIVSANAALGSSVSGTSVSASGALAFAGSVDYVAPEPLTVTGAGPDGLGVIQSLSGTNSFAGPITLAATSAFGAATGSTLTLSGSISGDASLIILGPGTIRLAGTASNTYTGTTTVQFLGTLLLAKSAGLAIPGPLTIGDGQTTAIVRLEASNQIASAQTVTIAPWSVLDLNGHDQTLAVVNMSGGVLQTSGGTLTLTNSLIYSGTAQTALVTGALDLASGQRTFQVADGSADVDLDVAAVISHGGLHKTGPGTLRLSGANTYAGDTRIEAGCLLLDVGGSLGTGLVSVSPGAVLELDEGASISNSVDLGGLLIAHPAFSLNPGQILSGTGTVQANLSSKGSLRPGSPMRPGTLTVTGQLMLNGGDLLIEILPAVSGPGGGLGPLQSDALLVLDYVNLGSTTLLDLFLGGAPKLNQVFTILDNRSPAPIDGFFLDLPEGAVLERPWGGNTYYFRISYVGGDGNDVTLTVIPEPVALAALLGLASLAGITRRR